MQSTLFIVPTPIGNLGDISFRAISILKDVDLIACEDTRHSSKLLQHFDISTERMSLHQHNEGTRSLHLLELLKAGKSIALISDAGTPLINDPGYELVNLCRSADVKVTALPGPCAFVTALSSSGFPTNKLCFAGFFPLKQHARMQMLEEISASKITYVFYESPRRIVS
ncbi:MAG: 16S rRNA (cytidine(1402)-2'-O)-methyltransferase, partial [Pseudomonadota bacterium]